MKVRKLYFFQSTYAGSMQKSVDLATHDIAIGGPGYIVTERRSGTSFLVHAATCTAELDKEGEEMVPTGTKRSKQVPA